MSQITTDPYEAQKALELRAPELFDPRLNGRWNAEAEGIDVWLLYFEEVSDLARTVESGSGA